MISHFFGKLPFLVTLMYCNCKFLNINYLFLSLMILLLINLLFNCCKKNLFLSFYFNLVFSLKISKILTGNQAIGESKSFSSLQLLLGFDLYFSRGKTSIMIGIQKFYSTDIIFKQKRSFLFYNGHFSSGLNIYSFVLEHWIFFEDVFAICFEILDSKGMMGPQFLLIMEKVYYSIFSLL